MKALFAAVSFSLLSFAASAQSFPDHKPIEMTVMFGAGSAADVTARQLADGMEKALGVPVPVVNRTGGGGAAGYTHVATQKPDGYSIVWNSNSSSTNYHSGILPFDYQAFAPVARVSVEIPALAVKADAPWKSLKDLIDYAQKNPGKLRIGNSGFGSHTHFAAAALFASAGAKTIDVPFGAGQAVTNLLGGRIEAAVQLPAAFVAHVNNGSLRVLAMIGAERDPIFPNVPTAREQGYNLALDMWRGIAVPKGTPQPVIAALQDAIQKTVTSPTFADAGKKIGFTPAYMPADEFGKLIARDDVQLAKIMADLGLKKN